MSVILTGKALANFIGYLGKFSLNSLSFSALMPFAVSGDTDFFQRLP
jgi:hypothetical protein